MSEDKMVKMRPMFLTKPGTISQRDIKRAERLCGICIIECKEPEAARFCEPPLMTDLDQQSRAALGLMRMIVRTGPSTNLFNKADLTKWFIDQLLSWEQPEVVSKVKVK